MASSRVNIATMAGIVLLIFAVFPASIVAKKERIDHGALLELSDLIVNLEKRLNDPNFDSYLFDKLKSPTSESTDSADKTKNVPLTSLGNVHEREREICEQDMTKGSIIRATDSINAGAEFVDSFQGTESNKICQEYCCRNSSCDVAVYQDKGDHYCYLFHCEGKCLFKDHGGYIVNAITRVVAPPTGEHSGEDSSANENELENLSGGKGGGGQSGGEQSSSEGNGDGVKDHQENGGETSADASADSSSQESSKVSTVEGAQPAEGASEQEPGPVAKEPQEPVISQHSVSLTGYCTQDIQCEDTNAACLGNNCRCSSGFYDKEGLCRTVCPPSMFECFELGTITRGPECVPKTQVCDSYMQCADGSDEFNCPASNDFPSGPTHEKSSSENKGTGRLPISKSDGMKSISPTALSHTKPLEAKNHGKSRHQDVISKSLAKSKPSTPEPSSTNKHTSTTPKTLTGKSPSPSHKMETNGGAKHLFVSSREKVIIASPGGGNAEGPIVALSLGLALTLVLLVMVACRLRGFKHRLSKGRPLNQNEADYLINGMYL